MTILVKMKIIETTHINDAHKQAAHRLWNEEYPTQIAHKNIGELEHYLSQLQEARHLLAVTDAGEIAGWAFAFNRDGKRWFAIIISNSAQGAGLGSRMLNKLKENETVLNGWAADHDDDKKQNGEVYRSPLGFYEKNGFEIHKDLRLAHPNLDVIKITWRKSATS